MLENINVYHYYYRDVSLEVKDFFSNYRLSKLKDNQSENIQIEYSIKKAIEHYTNKPIDKLNFNITNYGKPNIIYNNLYINISHSKDLLVIALANNDVGIDLQVIDSKYIKIEKKIFKDELNRNIDDIIKGFTIKESYLKYYGKSILFDLKTINYSKDRITGPLGNLSYKLYKDNNKYLSIAYNKMFNTRHYLIKDLISDDEFNIINKSLEEEE